MTCIFSIFFCSSISPQNQRLGARRANRNVDINRDQSIDTLRDAYVSYGPPHVAHEPMARPISDRHLIPEASEIGAIFSVTVPETIIRSACRAWRERLRRRTGHVVTRIENGHHLDGAAASPNCIGQRDDCAPS